MRVEFYVVLERSRSESRSALTLGLRLVWSSARHHVMAVLALQIVTVAALAALLQSGRRLVRDLDTPGIRLGELTTPVVALAAALFAVGVSSSISRELQQLVGERLERAVERDLAAVAASVPYATYERSDFHDLLLRATSRSAQSAYQLVFGISILAETTSTIIAVMFVLLSSVPALLPALFVVTLPLVLASRASGRMAYRAAYDLAPHDRRRRSIVQAFTGRPTAREVRVLSLAVPLRERWDTLSKDRLARVTKLAVRRGAWLTLAGALSALLAGAVLWLLVRATVNGEIELADAAVAVLGFQQLLQRVRSAAFTAGALRESTLFLQDYRDLVSYPTIVSSAGGEALQLRRSVVANGLNFTYPGTTEPVLRGISFEVHRGELVAIVGSSGSGKTSLIHLLAGLYEPDAGTLCWDDRPYSTIDKTQLWRSVAIMFQDFARFELSAHDNIALGDTERNVPVEPAAREAGIDTKLASLPAGYETVLNRTFGGSELSVGQWQRVALARALYRQAPLLLLDEPTAALDADSEARLVQLLRAKRVDQTVIMVSHRFSTVARADRILVVEDGTIVEQGTHSSLLRAGGRYAELFQLQQVAVADT